MGSLRMLTRSLLIVAFIKLSFTLDPTLSEDSSLLLQEAALLPICDQVQDQDFLRRCRRGVKSYWAYLAPQLYSNYIVANWETLCHIDHGTEDQCLDCRLSVEDVGRLVVREEVVEGMVTMVQGGLFCDMDGAWW